MFPYILKFRFYHCWFVFYSGWDGGIPAGMPVELTSHSKLKWLLVYSMNYVKSARDWTLVSHMQDKCPPHWAGALVLDVLCDYSELFRLSILTQISFQFFTQKIKSRVHILLQKCQLHHINSFDFLQPLLLTMSHIVLSHGLHSASLKWWSYSLLWIHFQ